MKGAQLFLTHSVYWLSNSLKHNKMNCYFWCRLLLLLICVILLYQYSCMTTINCTVSQKMHKLLLLTV